MKTNSPYPYGSDSTEEMMHTASLSETTGSIPTPPENQASAQSYQEVSGVPAPERSAKVKDNASRNVPVHAFVDPEVCIGCGVCEGMCPDVFELGEDHLAHAITAPVPPHLVADAEATRFACPVSAIDVKADDE